MNENKGQGYNENYEPPKKMTKKEQAENAGKDVAETAAKAAGTYLGGSLGGKVADKVVNTKLGQKLTTKAGKNLAKNPVMRSQLAKAQPTISQNTGTTNSSIRESSAKNNSTSNLASPKETENTYNSQDNENYDDKDNNNNSDKVKGKGTISGFWKKSSLKVKLIIIAMIAGLAFNFIFLVVMITPLMSLGIIDIEGIGGGGLGYSTNTYLQNISNECDSIVIEGKEEAISLEDYVAGVVTGEAWLHENMEALKAQAIAARTYAIVRSSHCTKPLRNSSQDQNYKEPYNSKAVAAANETEGIVLTYNSELFLSEYDSFYTGSDYNCNINNECSVTYTKHPNGETHTVTSSSSHFYEISGGHGRGMSQVASYTLADQGFKFDYILKYFYSPGVELMSLKGTGDYSNGLSAQTKGFTKRTSQPVRNNENDKKFYYSNNNLSYQGGFVGQCTWYAFGRANEILSKAGSDLKWNYAQHAKDWFDGNLERGANAFAYSKSVTEPKVGAIIVWKDSKFGHVAVVEAVNSDGTIDYSEANINSARSDSNPYGFRYQSHVPYKGNEVGTISHIWNGYDFVGYIYMIE